MKTAKYEKNKYLVIPWKYLQGIDQDIIDKIADHALKNGFNLENKYYVCNQDESYAEKVIETILDGENLKEKQNETHMNIDMNVDMNNLRRK